MRICDRCSTPIDDLHNVMHCQWCEELLCQSCYGPSAEPTCKRCAAINEPDRKTMIERREA
jgi:hypothetical protein